MHKSKDISRLATDFAKYSFDSIKEKDSSALPSILRSPGIWAAVYSEDLLALFYLDKNDTKRISEYINKNWNSFPGLMTTDMEISPIAYDISGTNNFFSSNRVSNMFSFRIRPGASLTILDHLQEFTDPQGQKITYIVKLAFILGLNKNEQWECIKKRLHDLFDNSINAWRKTL